MRALRPGIKGIVLLDSSRPQELLECFRSGAKGIFSRHDGLESLRKCIRCVHEGQVWLRGIELDLILEALARSPMVSAIDHRGLDLLSSREREVIQHLASGKTNREIADSLGLSPHTVKNYLFRMFDKVGVSSRTELLYLTMNHAPHGAEEDPDSAEADALAALVKAAEAGTPLAQLQLAEHYCGAHGSVPDLVSAYMWFLAGQQSAGAVQNELQAGKNKLSEVMSPEQLAEAERRAGEWLMEAKKRPEFATAVTAALMGIRKKSASAT
jgi:DNA-binding CsgD family transcriptional regulator